ncbi:MAG: hypothetical protein C0168_06655 [Candidatus Aminicenantes bacterium]|nr:MAG: hypothetical protein C0168_06655 [Candidatus Aminicenantes bacterium]
MIYGHYGLSSYKIMVIWGDFSMEENYSNGQNRKQAKKGLNQLSQDLKIWFIRHFNGSIDGIK